MNTGTSAVVEVTDGSFAEEVERAGGLSVVDFGAEWCGPCRMMAPVVAQLAEEYRGRAKVAKLDVDASPEAASRYGVRSLPTFLFFRDGAVVDRVVGAVPRPVLEQRIREHL